MSPVNKNCNANCVSVSKAPYVFSSPCPLCLGGESSGLGGGSSGLNRNRYGERFAIGGVLAAVAIGPTIHRLTEAARPIRFLVRRNRVALRSSWFSPR